MPLDTQTQQFLKASAEAAGDGAVPMWEMSPSEAREAMSATTEIIGAGPEVEEVSDHMISAPGGAEFRVRVFKPAETTDSAFLYLHGGGWVLGDIAGFDALGRALAVSTGSTVVLPEYRLAPEHPYPAAVDDAWATANWVTENLRVLTGADDSRLYIGGDSAGGNLAAVVVNRAATQDGPRFDHQFLLYPVTDADFSRSSYQEEENQTLLTTEFMQWFWDHYVPDSEDRKAPEASPLRAESLKGVPSATVITAAHDVLRDEGNSYAQKLKDAGVEVDHHVWEGQMHGFFTMVNILPASAAVIDVIGRTVQSHRK